MADRPVHSYTWFISDWQRSETRMSLTLAERGLYRELLDHCWAEGSLPDDTTMLRQVSCCDSREFARCWPKIRPLFTLIDGRLHHRKVDEGRKSLMQWVETRRAAGAIGGKRSAELKAYAQADAQARAQAQLLSDAQASKVQDQRSKVKSVRSTEVREPAASDESPPNPEPLKDVVAMGADSLRMDRRTVSKPNSQPTNRKDLDALLTEALACEDKLNCKLLDQEPPDKTALKLAVLAGEHGMTVPDACAKIREARDKARGRPDLKPQGAGWLFGVVRGQAFG